MIKELGRWGHDCLLTHVGDFLFTQESNWFVNRVSIQDTKLILHLVVVDCIWNGHPLLHTCKYLHCSWALTFEQNRTDENTHIVGSWEFTVRLLGIVATSAAEYVLLCVCVRVCCICMLFKVRLYIYLHSILVYVFAHVCAKSSGDPNLNADPRSPAPSPTWPWDSFKILQRPKQQVSVYSDYQSPTLSSSSSVSQTPSTTCTTFSQHL